MSSPPKLKKQALQHEHDRQFDKALAIYSRLLDEPGGADDEIDVALFNRAGDLALRVGDAPRAVTYYERAVDLYAAGGLLNNAIALCNKILRHAPDRVSAHYSLGVLHAKQGFRGDAKHHFVEYAERMHRAGRDEEALRALREFAELCAPGDDVRAVLGQHLARTGKGGQSAATLQAVFDAGSPPAGSPAESGAGARAAAQAAEPVPERTGDRALVFLDLTGDDSLPDAVDVPAVAGLEAALDFAAAPADAHVELDVLEPMAGPTAWTAGGVADGFEQTAWDGEPVADIPLLDVSGPPAGAYASSLPGELPMLGLPLPAARGGAATIVLEPLECEDDALAAAAELPLLALDAPPLLADRAAARAPEGGVVVADESLELLDLEIPAPTGQPVAEAPVPADAAVAAAAPPVADAAPPDTPGAAEGPPGSPDSGGYVDLGDWLRGIEAPRSTRMVTAEPSQTGDEAADFERMLDAFKAGVERNIDGEDFDSHYDLGVAFREMGLLEDAVTQFQRASRAPGLPLRALEALGQCFVDLGQPELALESLRRAADSGPATSGGADEQMVGVLYLLGVANEQTGRTDAASAYYRRVLAIDIQFRDASRRLAQLPPPSR